MTGHFTKHLFPGNAVCANSRAGSVVNSAQSSCKKLSNSSQMPLCRAANFLQPQTDWNATSHTLRQLLTSRLQRQRLKPTTLSPVSLWRKQFAVPWICKEGRRGQSWVTDTACMRIRSLRGNKPKRAGVSCHSVLGQRCSLHLDVWTV